MIKYITIARITALILLCSDTASGLASELDELRFHRESVDRHVYVGAGIGLSHLNPNTDAGTAEVFGVNDRVHSAGQLMLGVDVSKHIAAEIHGTRLGRVGFSPEGSIDYKVLAGSTLLYIGNNRSRFKRHGLTAFGRLGIGALFTQSNNINQVKDNAFHLLVGIGTEYMFHKGLGLRAEYISYEGDIKYGHVALLYRFGKQKKPPLIVTPAPAVKVPDAIKACNNLRGVLDGVNFHSDSANLTNESTRILRSAAKVLAECKSKKVILSAHTDSVGTAEYNIALSRRRAQSVLNFFVDEGIASDRLSTTANGEFSPIASNKTADGRRRNRRVELRLY